MAGKVQARLAAAFLAIGLPAAALAQDAAETAAILSASGQGTGEASRSLGSAVSGAINRANSELQATNGAARAGGGRANQDGGVAFAIPTGGDALAGTDAPTYTTGSGAAIRVSGTLRQPVQPACTEKCPVEPAPAAP